MTRWNSSDHDEASSGQLLAHEFIKLRFGIFDELGFPGDQLYPSQFVSSAGHVSPTSVSDAPVQGDWVQGTTGALEHCQHVANSTSCSLGSYPLLPRVNRYCRNDEIGQDPPSRESCLEGGMPGR